MIHLTKSYNYIENLILFCLFVCLFVHYTDTHISKLWLFRCSVVFWGESWKMLLILIVLSLLLLLNKKLGSHEERSFWMAKRALNCGTFKEINCSSVRSLIVSR